MKNIIVNDRGVFEQESPHFLPPQVIAKKRRILQSQIVRMKSDIQDCQLKIREREKEIVATEEALKVLNSPLVETYLQNEKRKQEENHAKAQA